MTHDYSGMVCDPPGRRAVSGGSRRGLYVLAEDAGQMEVHAQLVGSPQVVNLGLVDVGPSIIDVPKPGCWHLTLHGSGWTDTTDLVYNKD